MTVFVVSFVRQEAIDSFYAEGYKLTTCSKCGKPGALVPQGWFAGVWREQRVVHSILDAPGDDWREVEVCYTQAADEILLRDLLKAW
jgi:hypothetical protein